MNKDEIDAVRAALTELTPMTEREIKLKTAALSIVAALTPAAEAPTQCTGYPCGGCDGCIAQQRDYGEMLRVEALECAHDFATRAFAQHWEWQALIEARDAAIATAADRAGYERALRDVALSPGSYGLRHVLEALRQMPSKPLTSAPGG